MVTGDYGVVGGLLAVAETVENDQQTDLGHVYSNKANSGVGNISKFFAIAGWQLQAATSMDKN